MQIADLEEENSKLRSELASIGRKNKDKADKAEAYISELIGCEFAASHIARFDLISRFSNIKYEVKYSALRPQANNTHMRYTWGHILGFDDGKDFDRLILIGEPAKQHRHKYRDRNAVYVLFDVPRDKVEFLLNKQGDIHLATEPGVSRKIESRQLWQDWQTTAEELRSRYCDKPSGSNQI